MSNNIPQKPYKPLTPFRMFVKQNFPFIEATYEARDNYDLLGKVVAHLNTVEYNQGIAQENIEALYNFLDTLELQDEVNKKLDEMAQDGTLKELLNSLFYDINNQILTLQGEIQSVASGSPAGVYATKSDLETANPDHNKIYVVNADGNWYYYNTTTNEWTAGGVYQSTVDLDSVEEIENKMDILMPTLDGVMWDTRYSGTSTLTSQTQSAKKYTFTEGAYEYLVIDSYQVLNINIYTFFDSNNNIISYLKAPATTDIKIKEVVKVPDNATTLIVSVNNWRAPEAVVYEGTKAEIRENSESIGDKTTTLNEFENIGIVLRNGQFSNADGTWRRTDYINISSVKKLKLYSSFNDLVYNIGFYDINKNFISGLSTDQQTSLLEVYSFEYPENAYYIVACARNTIPYYLTIIYDNLYNTIHNLENKIESLEEVNYSGLRFACFGDSITSTEVTGTGTKINNELGTILIDNFAHGNATCSDWYRGDTTITVESPNVQYRDDNPNQTALYMNTNVLSNQVRRCLAKATPTGENVSYNHPIAGSITLDTNIWTGTGSASNIPDIIYIAISINDGLIDTLVTDDTETVFSQSYSELNKHGIASSLRWAIETLQSKFPNSQIFVCSPLQTGKTPTTDSRLDYTHTKLKRDIIAKVCEFCSVHFIDSFADSGFSNMLAHGIASSNNDQVHPTQAWSYNLARYISQNIKNRYTKRTH